MDQNRTPLLDALKKYVEDDVIPFHVPGHKRGKAAGELKEYLGDSLFQIDVNSMEELDSISNPISVIKESEKLLADLYGADDAFFLTNGTSQGVHAMIMNACQPGQEIIIPRNAHKSTVGALILSGAIPVYVQPEIDYELGMSMGMSVESVKRVMDKHPYAEAVFVIHPTYYGAISDLKEIIRLAHERDMLVLADEAHGAHMGFHPELPDAAITLGADMSAVSLHKTGGSLTQSSALLVRNGPDVESNHVKSVINLTQTTSASYLLMASLDSARKQLALHGREMLDETLALARYARDRINEIDGLRAFGNELIGNPGVYEFDETKLSVYVRELGMSGYEMESVLRKEYRVQIELSDLYNIMAIITIGDRKQDLDALIHALKDIARKRGVHPQNASVLIPSRPKLVISPRDAYYSMKKMVRLEDALDEISGEMIMAYPPGIPAICPGERITKEVIDYVKALKEEHAQLQGTEDPYVEHIKVLGES
jgi:arginine/lysine/ornithine decarboxylase